MIEIVTAGFVFVGLIGGLGLPLVASLRFTASERLCLGTIVGTLVLYLAAWLVYWCELPQWAFAGLPIVAAAALFFRRKALEILLADKSARRLAGLWAIVCAWCITWLTLVRCYSGGEWVADWLEHYHRTLFFLRHLPLNTVFLNTYILPARPPLANLVLTPFLALTLPSFAYYQVFLTLFSTLAFYPAALLSRRFRTTGGDPAAVLAILFMLSPLFVENATFSWTKLPATFFILAGLYFFLLNHRSLSVSASICLSLALLTHYSAAPYIVALVLIVSWRHGHRLFRLRPWKTALPQLAVAASLLSTWFLWSIWRFGLATFASNTAVSNTDGLTLNEQIARRVENFITLVIPHPIRAAEYSPLVQESSLGWWRDYFFNLYQTNLLFAFGTGGLVVILVLLWRHRKNFVPFWAPFLGIVLLLHSLVISWSDRWGSVHIGLQPVVLLGLAWIAASFPSLSRRLKICLIVGLAVDLICGILLHFSQEHIDLSQVYQNFRDGDSARLRGFATWSNYYSKASLHLTFLGDQGFSLLLVAALLVFLLALTACLANREWARSRTG